MSQPLHCSLAALALLPFCPPLSVTSSSPVQPSSPILAPHDGATVFDASERPFGRDYAEWSARWWQWFLSQQVAGHPGIDDPSFDVRTGQTGRVWHLASLLDIAPTAHVRQITVPKGKALLFGLLNFESSSLEDPFPQTEVEQRAIANSVADLFQDLTFTIDGEEIDASAFRFESPQFTFDAPSPWIFGPTGGTGTAVSDGYFVMVGDLSHETHTVHMTGTVPDFGLFLDMTYEITVRGS